MSDPKSSGAGTSQTKAPAKDPKKKDEKKDEDLVSRRSGFRVYLTLPISYYLTGFFLAYAV